ncbi:MAG TPA: hypothetical protein ENG92_05430, partial [Thiolapillus brandeum]|nr:hypothetical protein [Thiolapillus brandeum]
MEKYPVNQQPEGASHRQLTLAEQRSQMVAYDGNLARQLYEEDEGGVDLRDYWRIIMARKGTILLVTAIVVIAALINTSLKTPIYRATTIIQIDEQSEKVVKYEGVGESANLGYGFYQTQYELLKSKSLAQRVVDELGLESYADFFGKKKEKKSSFFSDLRNMVNEFFQGGEAKASADKAEKKTTPKVDSGASTSHLAGMVLGGLSISPISGSKLVRISYDSPDPKLAARIANAIARNFINTNLERRFEASSYAKLFLQERIKQVRADLEDSEAALAEYAKELEIINLDTRQSALMREIAQLEAKLVESQTQRFEYEASYREYNDPAMTGNQRVLESENINQYKQQLAALEAEYREKLQIYKPAFP